jgi:hypothetical protein
MTRVKQLQRIVALGFCACLAGPALAITDGVTAQGLRFVTGGITDDERDALGANSEPHGLKVVIVTRERGEYLADARVVIADANGRTLLDTRLDGPFLQVELDPGRYTVDVEFERTSMKKEIAVARGVPRELVFAFDADGDALPGVTPQ